MKITKLIIMTHRFEIYLILIPFLCGVKAKSAPSTFIMPQCEKCDETCMVKSANIVLKYIAGGVPSLNIKSIDPFTPDVVEGDDGTFAFKFTNNTIIGFGKCEFADFKLNMDLSILNFVLECPSLIIQGHYVVSGELAGVPLNKNGTYKVTTSSYVINFMTDIEKVLGSDGEKHLAVKKFVVAGKPTGPIQFHFNRFSPKQVVLRLAKLRFEDEKFRELNRLTRDAYRAAVFGPIFKYANSFLETIPVDDLFIK